MIAGSCCLGVRLRSVREENLLVMWEKVGGNGKRKGKEEGREEGARREVLFVCCIRYEK